MRVKKLLFIPLIIISGSIPFRGKYNSSLKSNNSLKDDNSLKSVYVLNKEQLAINRHKIQMNDPDLMPAYKALLGKADDYLQFGPVSVMGKGEIPPSGNKHDYMSLAPYWWPNPAAPNGLPYIRKDGKTNPEVKKFTDKTYLPELCHNVFTLSLAYYFSNDQRYAQHATRLIRVWFLDSATKMNPNMKYAQAIKGRNAGRGAGLIDARHFMKVIDAIYLLKTSSHWTSSDETGMEMWFTNFLNWMQTSDQGLHEMGKDNNHGVWYDALRLSIANFTGNKNLAKKVIYSAESRLDEQMDSAGRFPQEMKRTKSLHYSVFVMNAFFNIAQLAEKTNIDFWNYKSPSGKSLKKGFDILIPYLFQKKKWPGQQIEKFDFYEAFQILEEGHLKFGCEKCQLYIKNAYPQRSRLNNLLIKLLY